jgi:hypothetical protein
MKEEKIPVTYIQMEFEDSDDGRKAAFDIEFQLHQIPMNLRYEEC